ncbi:MAG: hypothetical protein QOJ11_3664 [Frankiales bacterium]|jgi:cell division protein FtsW (lipid II flippase)|nr:hypothetical protein [Frankiales bacterium]
MPVTVYVVIVCVSALAVVAYVTSLITWRPRAGEALALVLTALATVIAAIVPWNRR